MLLRFGGDRFQRKYEGIQHLMGFIGKSFAVIDQFGGGEFEAAGEDQLGLSFCCRSASNTEELFEFAGCDTALTLGDVAGDRYCGAPELAGEAKDLIFGEGLGCCVDADGQLDCALPDD